MSLIDFDDDGDDAPRGNLRELSVSEIAQALKRTVEDRFGHVRVRGEIGRVTRPRSGHVYLSLKDDRAVLDGVIWRGKADTLKVQPVEGLEVVVTGRLTTFPGGSRYQMIVESLVPAGAGALMAMLDARRKALAAEGLFAEERKRPLPYLPRVIGVVTSPSGAVIRDILHRLSERFPCEVVIWPVAVQGERCAPEVTAAIRGFNALPSGAEIPRPDLLIVARGGGSLEDLWGFNEEIVVRAAAESAIPLISAVGHETDVTLIDHAADLRAPTPTAAAEKAVPVRTELLARIEDLSARRLRAMARDLRERRERLAGTARLLARPETMLAERRQRLDIAAERLPLALRNTVAAREVQLARLAARNAPALLAGRLREASAALRALASRMGVSRLTGRIEERRLQLTAFGAGLERACGQRLARARDRLAGATRTLEALSYQRVLDRGFAVVRDEAGHVISAAGDAVPGKTVSLEFAREQHVTARIEGAAPKEKPARRSRPRPASQLDLFSGETPSE